MNKGINPLLKPRPLTEVRKGLGSYLDLDSVARVDGDGVAAVRGGVEGGALEGRGLDVALRPSQVHLAGNCRDWEEQATAEERQRNTTLESSTPIF